jgi:hypothetical protein
MSVKCRSLVLCFTVIAASFLVSAAETANNIAYVPIGTDLSSIRFETAKVLKVATTKTSMADRAYCESVREPGGSMFCSAAQPEAAPAYRVTYSFQAPPMPSDETGGTRYTFSVYFRPEQLSPAIREAIAAHTFKQSEAESYFALKTYRSETAGAVVDESNSTFCELKDSDGLWMQKDPKCHNHVTYKTVTAPAKYITVQVGLLEQSMATRQ